MVSNSPFATFLLPLLSLPSLFLAWHITDAFPEWVCGSKGVFVAVQAASFLLMLSCSLFLVPKLGWDWGQLIRSAREYVLEGSVANRPYFARYPNNLTWLSVLIVYFKLIKTLYPPATLALLSTFSQRFISITEYESERYEFPPVHWVMMSLEYGGYWQDDIDYTMSFLTYDERVKADRELLDQRIKDRGALGTFEFLTVTKAVRTWGGSCLAGDDYVGRSTRHPNSLLVRFLTQEGDLNAYIQPYYWLTHLTLLLSVAFSMFSGLKNPHDRRIAFVRFAFIGVYLFFTIWECNSRYLFPFVPLLMVCAVDGWRAFARMLRSWRELKEQRIEGGLV